LDTGSTLKGWNAQQKPPGFRLSGFAGLHSKSDDVILIDYPIRYPKKPRQCKREEKKHDGQGVGRFVDHCFLFNQNSDSPDLAGLPFLEYNAKNQ